MSQTKNNTATRPQHVRSDMKTREVVDQAIAAVPAIGLRQAAEFLSAMNVPPSVAIRTLVYPHRRRT
ncbi:hypothetical protein [Pseudoduganella namucuonensis]|uniref:Uncharacterized protein n=1 Tax=Pseudoduganella namucuonensis TaxID=1035707 RepID=A0A1I7LWU5_9BURK|nr:hypothetical protein [Pseudoduganella namucuonensis]SFV14174.1 hypothetical protein SAMN05216552_104138 [Pseudoduganella namucuonensis]